MEEEKGCFEQARDQCVDWLKVGNMKTKVDERGWRRENRSSSALE